jgi:hypothetical protein
MNRRNVALAMWLALALVLVLMVGALMAPSYLRWPPAARRSSCTTCQAR